MPDDALAYADRPLKRPWLRRLRSLPIFVAIRRAGQGIRLTGTVEIVSREKKSARARRKEPGACRRPWESAGSENLMLYARVREVIDNRANGRRSKVMCQSAEVRAQKTNALRWVSDVL